KIIPIVYGDTVKRVPGRLIQMPGHAYLAAPFLEHDTSIELTMTAEEMGIEPATEVTLTLGTPDFWEKVTGTFSSADSTTFNVTSRGTILATGQSPGTYGYQSGRYFLIDSDDLPEGTGSLIGYPIWIQTTLGQWGPAWVIDNWIESGTNIAVVRQ